VLGSVFAALVILLERAVKLGTTVRRIILAALAFIAGVVAYFPIQVLLLLSAAF
jgi:hypothetical protein